MELMTDAPDLERNDGILIRRHPLPDLALAGVLFGLLAAGGYGIGRIHLPWFAWLVFGPIVAVCGLLLLLLASTAFSAFLATRRPTHWAALVRGDGVYLNLRSYRNGHFGGDDPTVVHAPYSELESVGRVVEVRREESGDGETIRRDAWIELRFAEGIETEELEIACFLERTREAPETSRFGIRSRTKHHDVPVYVPQAGIARVQWHAGLLSALREHVPVGEDRTEDLDARLEALVPEDRARELVRRGHRFGAIQVLRRELGLDLRGAKAWIDRCERRAA